MWQLGPDGRVLKVSAVWQELVGRPALEAPGYCWCDYVHPEDRSIVEHIVASLAARRAYEAALRVRDQDGHYVLVEVIGEPQSDGGFQGWTRRVERPLRLVRRVVEAVGVFLVVA